MAKFELKTKTRYLRKQGKSLKEICDTLGISKGTASLWCRGISLTKSQSDALAKRAKIKNYAGALLGALANKQKAEQIKNNEALLAEKFINNLSDREICLIGTALYWAEGHKTGTSFGITNSDPAIIKVVMKWLEIQFKASPEDYFPRIFINVFYKKEEQNLKKFWSKHLAIPVSQFRNTIFINSKQKKIFNSSKGYNGVMHLSLRQSSKVLYRVLSQISYMRDDILNKS